MVMLCALFAALGSSGAVRSAAFAAVPSESHPALVRIGLQIHNLAGIDEVKERWEVTGTLIASWRDRSLAYRPRNPRDRDHDIARPAWHPVLVFRNEVNQTRFSNSDTYALPDGTVMQTQDFAAVLSTDLDLRRFPFDSETLPVIVESGGEDADRVILQFDPRLSAVPKARYAEIAQWKITGMSGHPDTETLPGRSIRGIAFALAIRRNSNPYVWKFIIPLILLVIVSWVAFWLSPEEFTTKDQLSTAIATLLIIVAFNLVASNQLPKTNYVTYIDAMLFVSFVFVIIAIGFIVAIHLHRRSQNRALWLRRLAGVALPLSFLVTQVLLVMAFSI
jgi:hypothetical protein